ncbi:uncharacterized protein PAE49_019371 [Odontesthes bonariensis]|uniref:uncharacterized protein LOC142366894 n=1 Tax=Odontesthes bonariensis TaxID=219752 RepID=UPI003F588A30
MFLSVQALRHLTPSPSPVDTVEDTEKMAHTEDPEEDQSETQNHISSTESLSSVSASSFTSASSLPLLKHPYVYERTVTLQRISSLLTDGENQSSEEEQEDIDQEENENEEEEGRSDFLPGCPKLERTPDGTRDPVSIRSLFKETLMFSAEGAEEDFKASPGEDIFSADALSGSLSSESHKKEHQSDCVPSQIFSFSEAATSDCFLETKVNQKESEHHQQEKPLGSLCQDLSCTLLKTSQDLQTDPNWSFVSEEIIPGDSRRMGEQDSSIFPRNLEITCSSLTLSLAHNIKTTSAPSATAGEISLKSKLQTNELCPPNISPWPDDWKEGSWWKQKTETHRASSGLLSAMDPGAMIKSDESSHAQGHSHTYSLVSFMDFTAGQRDGKQAEKEEPEGRSGKAQQGAIRRGRTRSRKGKRVKIT